MTELRAVHDSVAKPPGEFRCCVIERAIFHCRDGQDRRVDEKGFLVIDVLAQVSPFSIQGLRALSVKPPFVRIWNAIN